MANIPTTDVGAFTQATVCFGGVPKTDTSGSGQATAGYGTIPLLDINEGNMIFTFAPSGGATVGGAASVSSRNVMHFQHNPSGGVVIGGPSVPKLFKQNGVWSSDAIPWIPTGGVTVGGTAPFAYRQTMHFYLTGSGGASWRLLSSKR